ncbi:MAG TPA: hypothetical protein PK728_03915 [Bacillota bacterium]|nr:hypothetical protein [Bacillota bacterium]
MLYSELGNQILNIVRYGFSFLIVFVLWPRILFPGREEDRLNAIVSRYVKMACLTMAAGYFLVSIKLYELFSLVAVLLLISAYSLSRRGQKNGSGFKDIWPGFVALVYDFFDGLVNPLILAGGFFKKKFYSVKGFVCSGFGTFAAAGNSLLLISVFLYSAYLRFYDAVVHAAPAMSDAYVTLAWMKYIERRILFHDGIYPQGFHIYLTVLRKFAFTDPLYVLKYTGPLDGLFITLGLYFAVSRLTGRVTPGIVSAFIFGVLPGFLPCEWQRQASTNSQEFALVFLLPAWYYAACYFDSQKKSHFWAAAAAFAVIGWTHPLIFVFLYIGLFFLIAANFTFNLKESAGPAKNIILAAGGAGVLAVLPAAPGLLMGRSFHSSSADYLTWQVKVNFPEITAIDVLALGGLLLFFITSLVFKKHKRQIITAFFVLLLGLSSFAMYMTLGPLTGKAVLAARTGIMWSLLAAVGIGAGWFALCGIVPGGVKKQTAEVILCIAAVVCATVLLKPASAQPYKMQRDSMVEQYLRISSDFRPTEWMMVSAEEGYALALGRGWHTMLGDFLSWYDPAREKLVRLVDGRENILTTPDIFIFKEKNLFRVEEDSIKTIMQPVLERRAEEYRLLDQWLEKYEASHDNVSVYYEDEDIQVIRIHQPKSSEEKFREIWEGGG